MVLSNQFQYLVTTVDDLLTIKNDMSAAQWVQPLF